MKKQALVRRNKNPPKETERATVQDRDPLTHSSLVSYRTIRPMALNVAGR